VTQGCVSASASEEKREVALDSSQLQLYSTDFTNRTIHRIDLVVNPAQLVDSLNKNKSACVHFSLDIS